MPSDWDKNFRLGDACKIKHGFAFKGEFMTTEENVSLPIVVNIVNFQYSGGFRFDSSKIQRYNGIYPKEYELSPEEILVVMTCQTPNGEILGVSGKIPNDGNIYLHNQRMGLVVITDSEKLYSGYVYYLFLSPDLNRYLFATATGAKILHTAPSRIENYRFARPPLQMQQNIARILSNIDTLIENNRAHIQILEEIAWSLYNKWFLESRFLGKENLKNPQDSGTSNISCWTERTMDDISLFKKGKKPVHIFSGEKKGSIPYLLIDGINDGDYAYTDDFSVVANRDDTIMVMDGASSGDVYIGHKGLAGSTLGYYRTRNKSLWSPFLIYYFLKSNREQISKNHIGSAIPHANRKFIGQLKIRIPTPEVNSKFDDIANGIHIRISTMKEKNRCLKKLRNLLLPKLLSGEIESELLSPNSSGD